MEYVTIKELRVAIHSLQKDKILRLDGFPMEFFEAFQEFFEGDLLAVVEES